MPIYAGAAGVSGFVRIQLKVYDLDGVLADPDDVSITITAPDGTVSDQSGNLENPSTGIYHLDYEPSQVGNYGVYWVTTGVNAGTLEEAFNVDDLTVSPPLSLAQVKARLNIAPDDIADDDELRFVLLAAAALVEGKVGPLTRRPVSETHNGGRATIALTKYPIVSVTSVTDRGVAVTDYQWSADSGTLTKTSGYSAVPFSDGFGNVTVTYVAGRTAIPADLQQAILHTIAHIWKHQRGVSNRTRSGDEYQPGQGYTMPNSVKEYLEAHYQPGIA